jgi:hypothetical protein
MIPHRMDIFLILEFTYAMGSSSCVDLRTWSKSPKGGVDRRKLKFTTLNTLQVGVSVRIKSESERERGKQINQEYKADDTMICFTEVRFQRT